MPIHSPISILISNSLSFGTLLRTSSCQVRVWVEKNRLFTFAAFFSCIHSEAFKLFFTLHFHANALIMWVSLRPYSHSLTTQTNSDQDAIIIITIGYIQCNPLFRNQSFYYYMYSLSFACNMLNTFFVIRKYTSLNWMMIKRPLQLYLHGQ